MCESKRARASSVLARTDALRDAQHRCREVREQSSQTQGHLPFTEAQGREQRATRSSRWTKAGTVSTTTWRATRNQSGRQRPQRARPPAGSSAPPCPTLQGRRGSRAGHARRAEPERGRREAAAHDPPKPGIQGTGPLGVASGSIPEGDLHPLHWMAPSNWGPPSGPT